MTSRIGLGKYAMAASKDKKLTDSQLLGSQGASLIDQTISRMGYVWRPTSQHDTGIDGEIEIRDPASGRMSGLLIKAQSKAVTTFPNETDEGFDFYPDERDVRYWLNHNLPVILIVSQPATGAIYWLSVRDHASAHKSAFHFVKARDFLDGAARGKLLSLAQRLSPGADVQPLVKQEILTSNLLPVVHLPERLYLAETSFRDSKEIANKIWEINATKPGSPQPYDDAPRLSVEFVLRNKRIMTFRDLNDPKYKFLCDQGTVEEFSTAEWSRTNDSDKQREFVQLLNRCLTEMLRSMPEKLRFDRESGCYFFPPSIDNKSYDYAYRGAKKDTAREVFLARINKQRGHIMGYRHSAMIPRFFKYDDSWYLEVTPTYFFTKDGKHKSKWHGDWLKGIKELEKNQAVRGQMLMWADLLAEKPNLLRETYSYLRFGSPVFFSTQHGVDDAAWAGADLPSKARAGKSTDMQMGLL